MATQPLSDAVLAETVAAAAEEAKVLRDKILFTLEIYPFLGKSMIHQAIGSAVSRRLWGPILDRLVEDGTVCITVVQFRTPLERNQTANLYHLATRTYTPTHDNIHIAKDRGIDSITDILE